MSQTILGHPLRQLGTLSKWKTSKCNSWLGFTFLTEKVVPAVNGKQCCQKDSHSGGGVEAAAAREVKQDAKRAEGDPEKEVMVAEGDGKYDAEN